MKTPCAPPLFTLISMLHLKKNTSFEMDTEKGADCKSWVQCCILRTSKIFHI